MSLLLLYAGIYLLLASPVLLVFSFIKLYREYRGFSPLGILTWALLWTALLSPCALKGGHGGIILPSYMFIVGFLRFQWTSLSSLLAGVVWPFYGLSVGLTFALSALAIRLLRESPKECFFQGSSSKVVTGGE